MVRRRAGTAILVVSLLPIFAVGALVTADVVPDEITQNLNNNEDAVTNVMTSTTALATTLVVATSTPATLAPVKRIDVLAIGDSVMLGAARKLKAKGITVDAEKNRQFHESLQIFGYLKATRELGDNVVIHLGTNNGTTKQTLDRIMKALVDVKLVVFLTTHVPKKAGSKRPTHSSQHFQSSIQMSKSYIGMPLPRIILSILRATGCISSPLVKTSMWSRSWPH